MDTRIALEAAGVSLLLRTTDDGLPEVVHWGASITPLDEDDFDTLAAGAQWMFAGNSLDEPLRLGLLPEARFGWTGTPGLVGSRDGRDWSPAWRVEEVLVDGESVEGFLTRGASVVEYGARADDLALRIIVEMLASGLVRVRARLTNLADEAFNVQELTVRMPVPLRADEALDLAGRWGAERMPQHRGLGVGAHRREGRHGRTGADSAYVLSVGTPGFGYSDGEVWAVHTAWSGNHIHRRRPRLHRRAGTRRRGTTAAG